MTNCWQVAAHSQEVQQRLLKRTIVGENLILYRLGSGEAVAMRDRCPHRHLPLSLGCLEGDLVQCGYHGMRFDSSGECKYIPGQDIVPPNARVQVFPTIEKHRLVWVWMGGGVADPEIIPDLHWMEDPSWAIAEGYHHVAADYRLLVDNLLDLSHETFVHPETIGNGAVAESPASVKVINRKVVRAHRDMLNCEPPPQFVSLAGFTGAIDRWHTTIYSPPGFCIIEVGAVPAGSHDRSQGFEARILNLITPETERSSHYFWAHARNIRLGEPELSDIIRTSIVETFDQDKRVLEAQQIEIEAIGSADPGVVLKVDLGPIQGRSVLKTAIRAELDDRERKIP